jgi:hypothetical protein
MDAVDDPVQPRAEAGIGLEVEHQAVHPVLGERPEQPAPREPGEHGERAGLTEADDEQDRDRREEEEQGHRVMDARELVQPVAVEHARGGAKRFRPRHPF